MINEEFSIIHISDLHKGEDYNYNQLLDSLVNDIDTYGEENIPPVKFIVMSGDLIRGSRKSDIGEADKEIDGQYEEVHDFLNQLVHVFLADDIKRIIIVPGNHDINRTKSIKAMVAVEDPKEIDMAKELYVSGERIERLPYRWDWRNLRFMKITNKTIYDERYDNFVRFYDNFYAPIKREFPKDKEGEAYFIKFDEYNTAFACFNSCNKLDYLNKAGSIHSNSCHSIFADLKKADNMGMLIIGVWHHHIYGPPYSNDYLDREIIRCLGDNSIKIGLFGHQHKCEVVEELKDITSADSERKMLLISSGTLFGDRDYMLPGTKRQYNIISIKMSNGNAHITIRFKEDATNDSPYPKWELKYLPNGKNIIEYDVQLKEISIDDLIAQIDNKTRTSGDYREGFIQLKQYKENAMAKKLSDDYLEELPINEDKDADFIIQNISEPATEKEYAYLLEANVSKRDMDAVKRLLGNQKYNTSQMPIVIQAVKDGNKIIKRI